jgi:hypothetical protein
MFGYDNLANYFNCNFGLIQHHKWSVSEIENMLPWERQTYLSLLMNWLKEEKERIKLQQQQQESEMKKLSRRKRR